MRLNMCENHCAQGFFSDLLSQGMHRITNPMIRCQIAQINDLVNPCPELIPWITDLEMDSLERNATDQ